VGSVGDAKRSGSEDHEGSAERATGFEPATISLEG
jgi:hypothetical protein